MDRNKKIVNLSVWSIIVNIFLVIFKSLVGIASNSIAIILDAVNNLSDAFSSIITIIGTKLSNKLPDKKHPFGYGRIEYFSSVIIAVIILFAGVTSLKESINKIITPEAASYSAASLIVIISGVLVKFFWGMFIKKQGNSLNSGSLVASGTDAVSDSFLSLATLAAAIICLIWHISVEGYLGAFISLFIIKSAIEILKETVDELIGKRTDSELISHIKNIINDYDDVLGVYDITVHNYGHDKIYATTHIQVNDNFNARDIHRLTRRIALDMYEKQGIILTLGIYASNETGKYGEIKKYLMSLTDQYKTIIQMHGFYVDEAYKNISFDLIFDFDEKNTAEIIKTISDKLKSKYPEYDFSVILDTDFSE